MDSYKLAERRVGIRKFEKGCRLVEFCGRMQKAWRVPGTQEAGRHAMLRRSVADEADRLRRGEPGIYKGR